MLNNSEWHIFTMSPQEMTRIVNEELEHIPSEYDNEPQKILRYLYNMVRRRFLSNGAEKEDALLHCVETIKKDHQSWTPKYDPTFFRI